MEIKDIKILKLASGGGLPAYVSYTNVPLPVASYAPEVEQKSTDTKQEVLDEKMKKALYETGLVSDTTALVEKLDLFMGMGSSPFGVSSSSSYIPQYKLLIRELARLREGKEQLDNAEKYSREKGAFGEMAITTDGKYYVKDEDGKIKIKAKLEKGDNYLTNADLAELRRDYLPHANNLSTVIANSISMLQVTEYVLDITSKIGDDTLSSQFFKTKRGQEIKDGIDQLIADGADGTYKITSKTKDLKLNASKALAYILSTLPTNARALLKGKADLLGLGENGEIKILENLITSGLDSTVETSVDFDKQATNGATTDSNGNALKTEITPFMQYLTGKGGSPFMMQINPGLNYSIVTEALQYGQPQDLNGAPIASGSLQSVLQKGLGTFTDVGNGIYVGNLKVDPFNYYKVYIDTNLMSRAWLPAVQEADGSIHPDYDLLEEYSDLQKQIKNLGPRASKTEIENIISKSPLAVYLKDVKNGIPIWDMNKFKPFLMLNATVNGDSNWFGNGYEGVINPDTIGNWGTNIRSIPGVKEDEVLAHLQKTLGTELDGDLYSTIAYIPLSDSTVRSMTASKEYPIMTAGNPVAPNDIRLLQYNEDISRKFKEGKTSTIID